MADIASPIKIGKLTLKNRITMAPTVKFDFTDDTGVATDMLVEHYKERAEHGCALICVEATAVVPSGRFCRGHMGLYNDEQMESQKRITEAVHAAGIPIIIQLNHTGMTGNPELGEVIAPSAVKTRNGGTAHAMTIDEVHAMQQAYIDAAVRAKMAGYDGVQLHACHGYLINQFASPVVNFREDEYGGSIENRARFGVEIIKGIREVCGPDFLISARISGYEGSVEESIQTGEAYVAAGCDYLQVSSGIDDVEKMERDASLSYNAVCELGVRFHEHFKGRVPVSAVNGIRTPEAARYLLDNDLVDTIDLGCGILADPALPEAILNGTPYVECFNCARCQYGPGGSHKCPAAMKRQKTVG